MEYLFLTGSGDQKSGGICCFKFDTDTLALKRLWILRGIERPSFVLPHRAMKTLYSVEEIGPWGRVATFKWNLFDEMDRMPEYFQSVPCGGANPCHLSMDPRGRYLLVSNYHSGNLAVLGLNEHGIPTHLSDLKRHSGSSGYNVRQSGPHVHFSSFVENRIYCCDLGEDRIYVYELDDQSGVLVETNDGFSVPPGNGPRHFAVHPLYKGRIYILSELTGKLFVYDISNGAGHLIQEIETIPEAGYREAHQRGETCAFGAAIKFSDDGSKLFISIRGYDFIAICSLDKDGSVSDYSTSKSGGRTPRDFEIFGQYVIAANQDDDRISILKLSKTNDELLNTGIYAEVKKPTCIVKVPQNA